MTFTKTRKCIPSGPKETYKSGPDEQIIVIKKVFLQHWLLKGMKNAFPAKTKNTWDPHPINITNISAIKRNYTTLAESNRGPQIAEHMSSIVLQFEINPKYPDSIQLLKNFITRKVIEILVKTYINLT